MKLLMVHSDRDEMYGAVHSMLEMLTKLQEKYQVEPTLLVSKEGNVTKYCDKMGWKYCITGHGNFMMGAGTKKKEMIRNALLPVFYLKYKIKNFLALRKIERELNIKEFDIIHTNVNVCDIGAILSKKYKIPHVWHLREFGDLDYNRIVFRRKYIDFMNKNCNYFIAISDAVKNHWIKKGLDRNKVIRIYNGVEKIEYKKEEKNEGKIKCCFCGSISKSKGQHILLQALSKLNKEYLDKISIDILGDGPKEYVNSLKEYVKKNNLNKVVSFCGYKSNVRELLSKYDIGFMCSYSEGFGRVTVEYMMAGLCTIASNTGANSELIKNKETGVLFDYSNIEDLKSKIAWCINNYKEVKNIGKNSKQISLKNFTSEINSKNVFELYQKILGEKNER